ncbi:hypothetical protein BDV93DRAFT_544079 [Ceratobasidium sp. AG-I]|nr:hypothetical protein BDV93DRAFT_544079 [Ceratobasidium sp. AG-I]
MPGKKALAYILTDYDLRWRSAAYPFCDSKLAPKLMAFELFEQVEDIFPVQLMVIGINDDEDFGVAIVLGGENTTYDEFPDKLKKWAQHNFACEPRVFTRNGRHWHGTKMNGEGSMKLFMGSPLMSNLDRIYYH